MPRQVEKKAFVFYASTLKILEEFPEKRQGKIVMALIECGLDKYNYFAKYSDAWLELEETERLAFRSVLYEISVQKRRHYNKYLIRGAILTIQNIICRDKITDNSVKNRYIELIEILKEKYQDVIQHDELNIPGELFVLFPEEIYRQLNKTYKITSWRDEMKEIFEKRLENERINLSDDAKEKMLEELMEDYLESGKAFERYEELLEQYIEE